MSRIIPSSVIAIMLIALCNGQSQRQTVTIGPSGSGLEASIVQIRPSQTSTQRRTITFPSGTQTQTTIVNSPSVQTTVTPSSISRTTRVVNRPLQDIIIRNGQIISGAPGQRIQSSRDSIILGTPGQQTIISPSATIIDSSIDDDYYYD